MKPASFDFRAPAELAGVLDQMAAYGDDARILAGGQSLVPLMNLRHRRIKKQRRYERLAATSQLSLW